VERLQKYAASRVDPEKGRSAPQSPLEFRRGGRQVAEERTRRNQVKLSGSGEVREWLNRAVSKTDSAHFSSRTKIAKSSCRS
jgi:hypothetical protein